MYFVIIVVIIKGAGQPRRADYTSWEFCCFINGTNRIEDLLAGLSQRSKALLRCAAK